MTKLSISNWVTKKYRIGILSSPQQVIPCPIWDTIASNARSRPQISLVLSCPSTIAQEVDCNEINVIDSTRNTMIERLPFILWCHQLPETLIWPSMMLTSNGCYIRLTKYTSDMESNLQNLNSEWTLLKHSVKTIQVHVRLPIWDRKS